MPIDFEALSAAHVPPGRAVHVLARSEGAVEHQHEATRHRSELKVQRAMTAV